MPTSYWCDIYLYLPIATSRRASLFSRCYICIFIRCFAGRIKKTMSLALIFQDAINGFHFLFERLSNFSRFRHYRNAPIVSHFSFRCLSRTEIRECRQATIIAWDALIKCLSILLRHGLPRFIFSPLVTFMITGLSRYSVREPLLGSAGRIALSMPAILFPTTMHSLQPLKFPLEISRHHAGNAPRFCYFDIHTVYRYYLPPRKNRAAALTNTLISAILEYIIAANIIRLVEAFDESASRHAIPIFYLLTLRMTDRRQPRHWWLLGIEIGF